MRAPASRSRTPGSTVPRSSPTMKARARWLSSATIASSSSARVAHVGAALRAERARDPEQPEQAHHVVDAQAARVPQHGADGLDERLVARRRAGLHGMNGVSPQSWPLALNSSGGAPTDTSRASRSCQHQASAPGHVEADGQILDDARPRATRARAACRAATAPRRGSERAPSFAARNAAHVCAVRAAVSARASAASPSRGARPARVGRELGQRLPLPRPYHVEARVAAEAREQHLQRLALERGRSRRDRCGGRAFSARPGVASRSRRRRPRRSQPGHLLDAQEQRVAKAPAGRVVRARLDRRHRRRRGQRVDHHHPAAERCVQPPEASRDRRDRRSPSSRASAPRTAGPPTPRSADRRAGSSDRGRRSAASPRRRAGSRRW